MIEKVKHSYTPDVYRWKRTVGKGIVFLLCSYYSPSKKYNQAVKVYFPKLLISSGELLLKFWKQIQFHKNPGVQHTFNKMHSIYFIESHNSPIRAWQTALLDFNVITIHINNSYS